MVMTQTHSLAHIKTHLSALVDLVEREDERVILTKNGTPVAVLMSVSELEALEDSLDLLGDPEAMASLRRADEDIAAGRVIAGEELLREYRDK